MSEAERVKKLVERDAEAIQHLQEAFRDDVRFAILGEQWDEKALKARKKRRKPAIVNNRLIGFIRHVVNSARQVDRGVRVFPMGSKGIPKATAHLLDGAVRAIQIASDAPASRETALECAVAGGFGWYRIVLEEVADGVTEPRVVPIRDALSVVWDTDAIKADRSDCQHIAVMVSMSREAFKAKYDREPVEFTGITVWSPSQDQVSVCEFWEKVGRKVTQTILDGSDEPISTEDHPGEFLPFVFVGGEEYFIDGKVVLKGIVRDAKEPQRLHNLWKSEVAYSIDSRKTPSALVGSTAIVDPVTKEVYPEWKDPDSDTIYKRVNESSPFTPQFPQAPGIPTGAANEAAQSVDDIKAVIGIYDASLGARSNEQSGRAILARQAQGDVATLHFTKALDRAVRVEGMILADLCLKLYSQAQWIQIANEDGTVDQQEIGAMIRLRDGKKVKAELIPGAFGVVVKSGPTWSSRQEQTAEVLSQLAQSSPLIGQIAPDLLAQAADLTSGDAIGDRLRWYLEKNGMIPPSDEDQEEGSPEKTKRDLDAALQALEQAAQQIEQVAAERDQALQTIEGKQIEAQTEVQRAQAEAAVKYQAELDKLAQEEQIALARIASAERIAAADRASRERIAAMQAGKDIEIAQTKEQGSTARQAMQAEADQDQALLSAALTPPPGSRPCGIRRVFHAGRIRSGRIVR